VTLKPGESVDVKAFAFDDAGHKIGEVKVEWEKAGQLPPVFPVGLTAPKPAPGATPPPPIAGELSASSGTATKFTAAKGPNGGFGRVVAKGAGVTGYARVRVVPVLPVIENFDKVPVGRTPGGWTNAPAKFSVVDRGGNKMLSKRNDNPSPLVARSNAFMGAPDSRDYSVEAEVMGTQVRTDLPEIGIGACRYTLLLIGNDQEIRLGTWDAQKRVEKKVPFPWKPGVWYSMKLTTEIKDGKGIVKGKVWPRDGKEPEAWTAEIEDPVPNTEGSPLIYGFSTGVINAKDPGTEIYYDNIKVTPNKK